MDYNGAVAADGGNLVCVVKDERIVLRNVPHKSEKTMKKSLFMKKSICTAALLFAVMTGFAQTITTIALVTIGMEQSEMSGYTIML